MDEGEKLQGNNPEDNLNKLEPGDDANIAPETIISSEAGFLPETADNTKAGVPQPSNLNYELHKEYHLK